MAVNEFDIAIIAMACRFPGASDVDTFWHNIINGVESISFFTNEEMNVTNPQVLDNPAYVKAGSILPDVDRFDAAFFGYSRKDAQTMDPQQRLWLESAWEALERSGYSSQTQNILIGVFAGSGMNTYLINNVYPQAGFSHQTTFLESPRALQVMLGNGKDFLPTQLSYKLNLRGPSINVQTACSTGLVAVHLACQSLLNGECDIAIAGAAAVRVPQKGGYLYQPEMIWSPDGHCRAFDAQAQGTIFGNGVGVVVLKPLQEALDAGDTVHAVIKGTAVNNDGGLKVSYSSPSVNGQATVIADALGFAGVKADTITYVEAHGTGTALGDPIEIAALTQAFRKTTSATGYCAIGSVKTNLGHLAEAAGMAGLIKTVLALKYKQLPASLHFQSANPNIDFVNSPFYVNSSLQPWHSSETPLRAGVSAFGMGGTNAHIILEEAPPQAQFVQDTETLEIDIFQTNRSETERNWYLLTLSAKTSDALQSLVQNYISHLQAKYSENSSNQSLKLLADICFTTQVGRQHFDQRLAVVAQSLKHLQIQLQSIDVSQRLTKTKSRHPSSPPCLKVAFLFTGQGSQYVNMGRQLYETESTFRQILDRCNEILRPHLEKPLLEVLYPNFKKDSQKIGQEETLTLDSQQETLLDQTAYTQPALFAIEYALAQLWRSWGIEPEIVLGHSVGEYVAACVAGVFSLEDGLKLVAERGRLIQSMPQTGAMAVLMADESDVTKFIAPYRAMVSIAAINSPQQTVISGEKQAIATICHQIESKGIKVNRLAVSHGFHSVLMEPIQLAFEQVAQQVSFSSPQIKLISNVAGSQGDQDMTTAAYWSHHLRQTVQFVESIETLKRLHVNVLIEIGPKPVLLGLVNQCWPDYEGLCLASLRSGQADWQQLLTSLGSLYEQGMSVAWEKLHQDADLCRVELPTYPFQRQRYWIEPPTAKQQQPKLSDLGTLGEAQSQTQECHPLLGHCIPLAGTPEHRFQSRLNIQLLSWLQDHCIFGSPILPGTAYIEMMLAAANVIGDASNDLQQLTPRRLINIAFQQALSFAENSDKVVQIVVRSLTDDRLICDIYSLSRLQTASKARSITSDSWVHHASGELLLADKSFPDADLKTVGFKVDLSVLQDQCQEKISVTEFYQDLQERGIEYGASFQGVTELWRGERKALGKIQYPAELHSTLHSYLIHPAILDACLQVFDATLSNQQKQQQYLPIGIQQFTLYRPLTTIATAITDIKPPMIWSFAQLSVQETLSDLWVDLQLLTLEGDLIAEITGLHLKQLTSRTLLPMSESASWRDWLYQVHWLAKPVAAQFAQQSTPQLISPLPAIASFIPNLQQQLVQQVTQPHLLQYWQTFNQLENLSVAYVVSALRSLGWQPQIEQHQRSLFTRDQLADQLGIIHQHRQLLGRLLEILMEEGFLQQVGDSFEVCSALDVPTPQSILATLKCPEAQGEIAFFHRCGSHLDKVLQGKEDPLQLLFPQGDLTTLERMYASSPIITTLNRMVEEAVRLLLTQLPSGYKFKMLEIGAGGGTTASYLVPHLFSPDSHYSAEYIFTNPSRLFMADAQAKLSTYSGIRYQILDIDKSPFSQGFEPQQLDLILAVNVLHAGANLHQVLQHIYALLAPGGMVLIVEDTAPIRWGDLTFGLTQEWWKFRDYDIRPAYPMVSVSCWQTLLQNTGFEKVQVLSPADIQLSETILLPHMALMFAQKPCEPPHELASPAIAQSVTQSQRQLVKPVAKSTPQSWLIFGDRSGLGQQLATELQLRGDSCTVILVGANCQQVTPTEFHVNPEKPEAIQQVLEDISQIQCKIQNVIYAWGLNGAEAHTDTISSSQGSLLEQTIKTQSESLLHLIQALIRLNLSPRLWLITRGAQCVPTNSVLTNLLTGNTPYHLAQAPLLAIGKTIALEHPEFDCTLLDLDPSSPTNSQSEVQALLTELDVSQGIELSVEESGDLWQTTSSSPSQISSIFSEKQIAFRQHQRYVARLVNSFSHELNEQNPSDSRLWGNYSCLYKQKNIHQATHNKKQSDFIPQYLTFREQGSIENLQWQPGQRRQLAADEVEIQVYAAGLNFRDLLNVLGLYPGNPSLGSECSGVVVAVGEQVEAFAVGDAVMALADGSLSQYVTVKANRVVPKPLALSFEAAATIPAAFITAAWSLKHLGQVQAGERVLIHAAAGGVGQAAVQLAQQAGATVLGTASAGKWDFLQTQGLAAVMNSRTLDFAKELLSLTQGQGVDLVLNSLTGEGFIEKSLSVLAEGGRFIELAKRDIWTPEQMGQVRADVSYFIVALEEVCQKHPQVIQSLFQEIYQQLAKGLLQPIHHTVFSIDRVVDAFRQMQQAKHLGKIVLTFPRPSQSLARLRLSEQGTYLVVGGFGGLGQVVAQWLVDRGAKSLALIGRKQPTQNSQDFIQGLEQQGVSVLSFQADVSDLSQVVAVLSKIEQSFPPLRGIFHTAAVLEDAALRTLTWDKFQRVLAPKVSGAWNLHQLTQKCPLDFFVLFSSMGSMLGAAGQANYVAANEFLDALAHYRQSQGLPCLSINWGAWAQVGMAVKNQLLEQWQKRGVESLSPQTGLEILEQLLLEQPVQVGVLQVDWSRFLRRMTVGSIPAFFEQVFPQSESAEVAPNNHPNNQTNLLTQLLKASPQEQQVIVIQYLNRLLSEILGLDLSTPVDVNCDFFSLGMDSLTSIELRNRLQSDLNVSLSLTVATDYTSILTLADHLIEKLNCHKPISALSYQALMEKDAQLEAEITPTISSKPIVLREVKSIFLTGATGFIGAFLLDELIRTTNPSVKIYCLVRDLESSKVELTPDFQSTDSEVYQRAKQRILQTLKQYHLDTTAASDRIVPVVGDLSQPYLGLSHEQFHAHAANTDFIFHCGAFVNLMYSYKALQPVTVEGTREILRFACAIKPKPLHYLSTIAIFPPEVEPVVYSANANIDSWVERLEGGYPQTKWVAEKLVWQAIDRGLPVCIYRPGNIGHHSYTGAVNPNDLQSMLINACRLLQVAPKSSQWTFELTPIDFLVRVITKFANSCNHFGQVYNVTQSPPMSAVDVFESLEKLGWINRYVSLETWRSELSRKATLGNNVNLQRLSQSLENALEPYLTNQSLYDCSSFESALLPHNLELPRIDQNYWAVLQKNMK
jgi:thioester reductase-like protein